MREKILVTGATGKVGSEVVRGLLAAGAEVKAGTRRTFEARRRFGAGVEVVELDYRQTSTWDAAVEWADRVLLVPPPFDADASESLVPFLDWAVASKVRHIVLLSAMAMEQRDDVALRQVEKALEESGVEGTVLRPNLYMQNFGSAGEQEDGRGAGGLFLEIHRAVGALELPAGDARVSFVDGGDVARVATEALTSDEHFGRTWTLTGPEALSFQEALDRLARAGRPAGETGGRSLGYRAVGEDRFGEILEETGWRPAQAEVIVQLFESVRGGIREEVTDDLAGLLAGAPRTFDEYAAEVGPSWG